MKKRMMSILLMLALLCALLPQTALIAHAETVSGSCGENLYWNLDLETGVLTISGNGPEMARFASPEDVPWHAYRRQIKEVTWPNDFTFISEYAFYECSQLRSVDLSGLMELCDYAFAYSGLEEVTLPYDLMYLGRNDSAFYHCDSLQAFNAHGSKYTSIDGVLFEKSGGKLILYPGGREGEYTIPEAAMSWSPNAFRGAQGLTGLTIPDTFRGLTPIQECPSLQHIHIGKNIPSEPSVSASIIDCPSLTEITVSEDNEEMTSIDGVLYSKDGATLMYYPQGRQGGYEIVPGTKVIGPMAFNCSELQTVSFPESVEQIGFMSFSNLQNMTEIILPDTITEIYNEAFSGSTRLKKVHLGAHVQNIYSSTFSGCTSLEEVNLPEELTHIYELAFHDCPSLKAVTIPADITEIEQCAFGYLGDYDVNVFGKYEIICDEKVEGFTITGYENTEAHRYAKENEFLFISLGKTAASFQDVVKDSYYYSAVRWAVENGITNGTSETKFSPSATCTRGQVVTFLWRAKGSPDVILSDSEESQTDSGDASSQAPENDTANPFTDVSATAYYYKPVLWAVQNGVTSGTSATTFSPGKPCTRGQVVTFLWRAEGEPEPAADETPFTDVQMNAYYYKAVLWAVENGVTQGTSATKFSPNATCTRAQVVTFLYRACAE